MSKIIEQHVHTFAADGERFESTVWDDGSAETRIVDIATGETIKQRKTTWNSIDSAMAWCRGSIMYRYGYGL